MQTLGLRRNLVYIKNEASYKISYYTNSLKIFSYVISDDSND